MNMTCIHNFQFTTIRVTGVFIFISVLLTMPSKYSSSLGSFFVCAREANLVHNHCMDLEYIYIYIIINFVYLLLHEEIWLHIIHYLKKLHISKDQEDQFILGFITFRDPAWNTTQKNSHKWSHLIRYGWCDEFISFVTYVICWYKSFSHSWWQLHVRTSKKQKFF